MEGQGQRIGLVIAGVGQQGAGGLHVARRRRDGRVIVGLVERADGAVIAQGAVALLDHVEDRLAVGGQLQGLDDARIVAGRAVGAQADEVKAIGGNVDGRDAGFILQAV